MTEAFSHNGIGIEEGISSIRSIGKSMEDLFVEIHQSTAHALDSMHGDFADAHIANDHSQQKFCADVEEFLQQLTSTTTEGVEDVSDNDSRFSTQMLSEFGG